MLPAQTLDIAHCLYSKNSIATYAFCIGNKHQNSVFVLLLNSKNSAMKLLCTGCITGPYTYLRHSQESELAIL